MVLNATFNNIAAISMGVSVYSIQSYVIKFNSDLRQVGGFLCGTQTWVKVFSILTEISFFLANVQTVFEIRVKLMIFF
jgi:hypothetical protein